MTQPILVTGGDGQLGRDLVVAGAASGVPVVGMGRAELDVTDAASVRRAVAEVDPVAVIHAAAWTDVDGAEANEAAATAINEGGVQTVVAAAAVSDTPVVVVSTDYVFDGRQAAGYAEDDVPNPINAYGRSKLAGEQVALEYEHGLVARTSWLFGEFGSNFPATMDRLTREQDRDHIEVVTDQVGTPTWTRHLADALISCVEHRLTGIVHLAGAPAATWHEVASAVVAANGSGCDVRPTTTDAFPRPAKRPVCSILRSTRSDAPKVGNWQDGISAVVAAWAADRLPA